MTSNLIEPHTFVSFLTSVVRLLGAPSVNKGHTGSKSTVLRPVVRVSRRVLPTQSQSFHPVCAVPRLLSHPLPNRALSAPADRAVSVSRLPGHRREAGARGSLVRLVSGWERALPACGPHALPCKHLSQASILDLHSGALSVGKHFVNLYR